MKHSELPITLWNGRYLDGILTITTFYIPEQEDIINNTPREVTVVLQPNSNDMSYVAISKITDQEDSIAELLNSITHEYIELVMLFKNRELESGVISLH